MMSSTPYECSCGYSVTYYVISDAHDPNTVTQFVYKTLDGMPVTGDICPQCGSDLWESASKVEQ